MFKRQSIAIILVVIAGLPSPCAQGLGLLPVYPCYAASPRYTRVLVSKDIQSLNIKVPGPYEISDASGKTLQKGNGFNATAIASKNGILIGDIVTYADTIFIKTESPDAIIIDDRKFSGYIQLTKEAEPNLLVINHVDLEDYLKGILYHEVSHYWPMEVLKAQAVVCRTFALYYMERNKTKAYDLTSDIYSQVYGGRTSERYRTNMAVEETKGLTLVFKGKIFLSFYHATCAGHTESGSLYGDSADIPPLKGVTCGFCKDSPHLKWHTVLSKDDIKEKIQKAGYKIRGIDSIILLGRNESSRITRLKIISGKENITLSAKDFREALGPNNIKSTNFQARVVNEDVVFVGFGWGHGIGLCQWGAYFMAKQGYNYEQILKYYYPGAELSGN